VGPKRISQGAGICAGTIAPGCRKRRLALLVIAPLGSRSCQAGRNYEIRGFCAASCCIIPILLHPPAAAWERGRSRQILGAEAASGGRRWAGDLRGGFYQALVRCHRDR
jgi:hypothetical protein